MQNSTQIGFTAPHHSAAKVGNDILSSGGTAVEAMVAAAASIAVVYPHMNGLGGDGFWIISEPGCAPVGIDASGVSASLATKDFYSGVDAIPSRGGKAALTMAGAVAGWQKALELTAHWQQPMGLPALLSGAITQAKEGISVTQSMVDASVKTFSSLPEECDISQFQIDGAIANKGDTVVLSKLAETLTRLSEVGLSDFYHGQIAKQLAADLEATGSPIRLDDFAKYQALEVQPLSVKTSVGTLYNLPAPTQGIASLLILALFDRVKDSAITDTDFIHLLIECTKQAFLARNQYVSDPSRVAIDLHELLQEESLAKMQQNIKVDSALEWPFEAKQGDTIWMGACDNKGRMVSYIQSLYWEYGSGVVSPSTGIVWNNRGTSFSLENNHLQQLAPGLKPFHTLNPAFAELQDGRRLSYGTMGGEGQPQTQAAVFSRAIFKGHSLQESIAMGRWLLGRTWGDQSHNLKIEADIAVEVSQALIDRGHDLVTVDACNELMGHAGAVLCNPNGSVEAATDPRSDGQAFVK